MNLCSLISSQFAIMSSTEKEADTMSKLQDSICKSIDEVNELRQEIITMSTRIQQITASLQDQELELIDERSLRNTYHTQLLDQEAVIERLRIENKRFRKQLKSIEQFTTGIVSAITKCKS